MTDKRDDDAKPEVPDYSVEPVPKVPHKIGWRWAVSDIIRIVFLGGLLTLVIVARKPCSDSVGTFVDTFSDIDAGTEMKLERLTPEKIRERFGDDYDAGPSPEQGRDASPSSEPVRDAATTTAP